MARIANKGNPFFIVAVCFPTLTKDIFSYCGITYF